MKQEIAETRALHLLAWLTSDEELLPLFLGATGASEGDLRARAGDPDFLASVLDFLLMDDAWVIRASEAAEMRPEELATIRAALPGGDLPNWT